MSSTIKYANVEFHRWKLGDIAENERSFVIGRYRENDLTRKIHTHEFIQIYYIVHGVLKHKIEDETGYVAKGDVFILTPDIYHYLENVDTKIVDFISIDFMPEFIDFSPESASLLGKFINYMLIEQVISDESPIRPKITFSTDLQLQVESIVMDILGEYQRKREGYMVYIKGQLLRLLVIIAREYISTPYCTSNMCRFQAYSDAILKSIAYIEKNFIEDIKIDDVAKNFLLSRTYFCDLFKKYTGKTFNKYINDLRISFAKRMLACSDTCITDIAYNSGFNDATNFCRKFKQQVGITPSAYRKSL